MPRLADILALDRRGVLILSARVPFLERIVARSALNAHASGVTVRYDPSKPAGSRIVSVTMSDGIRR